MCASEIQCQFATKIISVHLVLDTVSTLSVQGDLPLLVVKQTMNVPKIYQHAQRFTEFAQVQQALALFTRTKNACSTISVLWEWSA